MRMLYNFPGYLGLIASYQGAVVDRASLSGGTVRFNFLIYATDCMTCAMVIVNSENWCESLPLGAMNFSSPPTRT